VIILNLNEIALQKAAESIKQHGKSVTCPFCHKGVMARSLRVTCPHCHKEFDINLKI